MSLTLQMHISYNVQVASLYEQAVYRQYRVLVDHKNAQHAESDWLTIQTVQKYIYLHIHVDQVSEIMPIT